MFTKHIYALQANKNYDYPSNDTDNMLRHTYINKVIKMSRLPSEAKKNQKNVSLQVVQDSGGIPAFEQNVSRVKLYTSEGK